MDGWFKARRVPDLQANVHFFHLLGSLGQRGEGLFLIWAWVRVKVKVSFGFGLELGLRLRARVRVRAWGHPVHPISLHF